MKTSSLLLFFTCLLFTFPSLALETDERIYEELRKKVQQNSYYDSTQVFRSGEKAIHIAQKLHDKGKEADIYIFYGNFFYYNQQFDRARDYYNKAFYLARTGNAEQILRLSQIRLTYILEAEGKTAEARRGFSLLLSEALEKNDPANAIECYNALALMSDRENKLEEAMDHYLKGLRLAEENKLDYYTGVVLNNIGLLKLNSGETDEALEDFNRGLQIANKEKNLRLAGHIQNNIGLVFLRLNKDEEALSHFRSTVQYARMINHPKEIAVAYINFSSALLKSKKTNESILYLDSAILVLEKNNMRYELTKAMLGKAEVLLEINKTDEAIEFAKKTRDLCIEIKNLEDRAFSHLTLHKAYEKKNLYELALKEYKTFRDLDDSLKDLSNSRMIKELQVQYDVEKKENQLEQEKSRTLILEQENQLKKVRIRIVISIGIVIVAVLIFFFYLRNMRNLRIEQERFSQQLIANTEKERSRIARDLHDDIGQSLSAIKSRLNILGRNGEKIAGELESEVGKVIEQTREISRMLYPSYLEKIGLTRSIARLMEKVQNSSQIECSFDVCDGIEQLSLDKKTHLYRIIQECVNNTIKHSNASALKISLECEDDNCEFLYRDNGKGINNQDIGKGLGFMSMNERARILGGEMQISDNAGKGVRLSIKFNFKRNIHP